MMEKLNNKQERFLRWLSQYLFDPLSDWNHHECSDGYIKSLERNLGNHINIEAVIGDALRRKKYSADHQWILNILRREYKHQYFLDNQKSNALVFIENQGGEDQYIVRFLKERWVRCEESTYVPYAQRSVILLDGESIDEDSMFTDKVGNIAIGKDSTLRKPTEAEKTTFAVLSKDNNGTQSVYTKSTNKKCNKYTTVVDNAWQSFDSNDTLKWYAELENIKWRNSRYLDCNSI